MKIDNLAHAALSRSILKQCVTVSYRLHEHNATVYIVLSSVKVVELMY